MQSFVESPRQLEIEPGTEQAAGLLRAVAARHGAPLAAVAARLDRLFLLRAPRAPGLRFAGGSATTDCGRLSFAGGGLTIEDAVAGCLGEAAERLSQIAQPGDVAEVSPLGEVAERLSPSVRAQIAELLARSGLAVSTPLAWCAARCAATGEPCLVPADWCLRQTGPAELAIPDAALSTGCAAGPTFEAAALRAVLELVERDAASLWWIGGRQPRTPSLESAAAREGSALLHELRGGTGGDRVSWLLDLGGDLGVPVVAAASSDPDGSGLAFGLAARLDAAEATRAALFELCQMELALGIASARASAHGEASTPAPDRELLRRARELRATDCSLLHPAGAAVAPGTATATNASAVPSDTSARLGELTRCLAVAGINVSLVDLTRADVAVPVVHAVAPLLQLMPSSLVTQRLRAEIAATGGGERHTKSFALA